MWGTMSGKQRASSRGSIPQSPTSLNPGVSTRKPPIASGTIAAETVVFLPRRTRSLISPVRNASPGSIRFSSEDFPAPDGPVSSATWSLNSARSSSTPAPVEALTG